MVPDVYVTSADAPLAAVAGEMARLSGRIRHRAAGTTRWSGVFTRRRTPCGRSPTRSRRGRQRQREAGSAGPRLDADRAAVVGDDAVNEREAEPRPLVLGREEGVEHGQLLGEAGTVVLDVDLDLGARGPRARGGAGRRARAIASMALRVRLSST